MQEKRKSLTGPQPAPAAGIWDETQATGVVTVAHGPYAEQLPVANMTVAQIRTRYAARFDIDPASQAFVDGNQAGDDTVVRPDQVLMFARRAGEKGGPATAAGQETITIKGDEVRVVTPEGEEIVVPFARFLELLAPPHFNTCGMVMVDGVKAAEPVPGGQIVVHQTPPRVYNFKWIAKKSRMPFGRGATYRDVRIALPYLIVIALFTRSRRGGYALTDANECFFANQPLKDLDDEVSFPALLNCSKMQRIPRKPLAWICTQHLDKSKALQEQDPNLRMQASLKDLLGHLLETGFNYSSEHHELSSWFSETVKAKVDKRISSVEAWEEATREDPLFVLDVPWLPTGMTVRQIIDKIATARAARAHSITSAADAARIVINSRKG